MSSFYIELQKLTGLDVAGGTLASTNAYIIREVNADSSDIEIEVTGLYSTKQVLDTNVNSYVAE